MLVKLESATGEVYTFPDGFYIKDLPAMNMGTAVNDIAGLDGGVVDMATLVHRPREVEVVGRLMDSGELVSGTLQEARAAAMTAYFTLSAFVARSQQTGPMKIYKEKDIIVDPEHANYDAELAPLGYYLLGHFKGGSAVPLYGENAGGGVLDVRLRFVCPNPFWQGYFKQGTANGTAGGGSSFNVAFSVLGSVPAKPQFILYSTAGLTVPSGKKITLTAGTLTLDWAGTIAAAGYVVFDCATGQVFSTTSLPTSGLVSWAGTPGTNKASGLMNIANWAYSRWQFATGNHTLVVSSDMASGAALTCYTRFSNEYYG